MSEEGMIKNVTTDTHIHTHPNSKKKCYEVPGSVIWRIKCARIIVNSKKFHQEFKKTWNDKKTL